MNAGVVVALAILVAIPACGSSGVGDTAAPKLRAVALASRRLVNERLPLPPGVAAWRGPALDQPTDDLAPLWALVGDARVIGLGESIHTSGGYYATKARLIHALVEEHGVRWFA